MRTKASERRFERGAWWTVTAVFLFALTVISSTVYILAMPGDGWQIDYGDRDQGNHRLTYFMGAWETPLLVGDVVTAVNGHPLPTSVQMRPSPPPADWVSGGTVNYTIQRQGETIDMPVTLHRLSLRGILRGIANTMRADLSQWSWFFVGLLVFWLRPNNKASRLLFIAGTCFVIATKIGWAATTVSLDVAPPLIWYLNFVTSFFFGWLFFPTLILLLLTFPLPLWPLTRFPRLTPTLFYGIPLVITAFTLLTSLTAPATALLFVEAVLIFATAVTAIVQVYRQKQNRVARAQVTWVALGIGISIGGSLIFYLLEYTGVLSYGDNLIWSILSWPLSLALPICLAIAILRYRLFDINVIVRKTLVYAVLSGLLALVYFGLVVLLQSIFDSVSGQQSPIAIVISTLVIAALFNPLRQRVQAIIDRRFFRKKYDAQQVLAQFAQTARDETDMEALQAELLRVVQETMQPEGVSLWLQEPRR